LQMSAAPKRSACRRCASTLRCARNAAACSHRVSGDQNRPAILIGQADVQRNCHRLVLWASARATDPSRHQALEAPSCARSTRIFTNFLVILDQHDSIALPGSRADRP
jgi:hypothetical protein